MRLPAGAGDLDLAQCTRSSAAASLTAFRALLLRDLAVLWKNFGIFAARTLVQPFLLVFVFLYVFPNVGQGVGGGQGAGGEYAFATILVAGVVGLSIMFQGLIAAVIVFPIAWAVHAREIEVHLAVHWPILVTIIPMSCIMTSSLGLVLGTRISPRNISVMFGFIVLPITFLGGTYYPWTELSAVKAGGFPWLQALVCVNPLIYVTEGFRAALTTSGHMHLYVVYPVLLGLCALLLWWGIRGFRRRVLS